MYLQTLRFVFGMSGNLDPKKPTEPLTEEWKQFIILGLILNGYTGRQNFLHTCTSPFPFLSGCLSICLSPLSLSLCSLVWKLLSVFKRWKCIFLVWIDILMVHKLCRILHMSLSVWDTGTKSMNIYSIISIVFMICKQGWGMKRFSQAFNISLQILSSVLNNATPPLLVPQIFTTI